MLKASELRNLGVDELQEKLKNAKKGLMQHRFQAKTGKLERQTVIPQLRRDIARILTILNEKIRQEVQA